MDRARADRGAAGGGGRAGGGGGGAPPPPHDSDAEVGGGPDVVPGLVSALRSTLD